MKKFILLILLFTVFTVSGCGYNSSYTASYSKPLNSSQINKLNNIMFAYLNIPVLKFAVVSPPETQQKTDNNFYQPSAVIKTANEVAGKPSVQKTKPNRQNPGKKSSTKQYNAIAVDNKLFFQIFSRKTVQINKTFNIKKVDITIKEIRYDKGYEIVSLALTNKGQTKTIMENFKYSNAGNSFEIKKFEVIQNLTLANKYKRGMILWLKFQ